MPRCWKMPVNQPELLISNLPIRLARSVSMWLCLKKAKPICSYPHSLWFLRLSAWNSSWHAELDDTTEFIADSRINVWTGSSSLRGCVGENSRTCHAVSWMWPFSLSACLHNTSETAAQAECRVKLASTMLRRSRQSQFHWNLFLCEIHKSTILLYLLFLFLQYFVKNLTII